MLKSKLIDKVNREVYRKHPDVKGKKPQVKKRSGSGGGESEGYLLIYRAKGEGPGGKKLNRVVRAVVDDQGRIKKLSTSK